MLYCARFDDPTQPLEKSVNAVNPNLPAVSSESTERKVVLLLCCAAAVHVFIYSAAFPFFNNVDEQAHFDLVIKYSQGHIPLGLELYSAESVPYCAICGSPEYLNNPAASTGGRFQPPLWMEPPTENIHQRLLALETGWRTYPNHESLQQPLYYALAGLWWHLGQWCGLKTGHLLYWLRFLNMFIVAALVWVGYIAARLVFPGQRFLQLSVPALLAFMPQTAFYSVQNDILLPICFGLAFICLVRFWYADVPGGGLGMAAGLALAATFLTKISSLPLLAVSGLVVLAKIRRLYGKGKLHSALPALAMFMLSMALPIGGWMAWTKHVCGDFTGTAAKIQFLGWTVKPFGEWWHHPIFTPHGLWVFISELLASFWRGEFTWHLQRLALPAIDAVYVIASVLFAGVTVIVLLSRFMAVPQPRHQALWFCLGSFIATMAFLGFLSVIYDFHDCFYPSHNHPYFTSGRLMLGALIPFQLLFVYGLERALSWVKQDWPRWVVLAGFIVFMLISEIAVDWPVFFSQYNRFHM